MTFSVLIHGPTASGKTALSLALAAELGAEVINADAMQVYSDLAILTARPSAEEASQAPHHLFGHIDASASYSTGKWLAEALERIRDAHARNVPTILIGGTGLYLKVLTEGLHDLPDTEPELRAEVRALIEAGGLDAAYQMLVERDPAAALRIRPTDTQRISRVLELVFTGQSAATPPKSPGARADAALKPGEWLGVCLYPDRAKLYARINARFAAMIENGALEEARALHARRLDPALPCLKAHGMPGLCAYFDGEISLEAAIERGARDTRHYAKRQFTWMAHQFPGWPRLPVDDVGARKKVVLALLDAIDGPKRKR
jgi:tRNA dimethylallyltransferase